jgi:hypothetical protein
VEFGQTVQRKARMGDELVRRWVWLDHPGRKQSQGPIRLMDDEMITSRMPLGADNTDEIAASRMIRIGDLRLKSQTPGSMTLVRPARAKAISRQPWRWRR